MGLFSDLFGNKTPQLNSFNEVASAAIDAFRSNKRSGYIKNILKQSIPLLEKATKEDFDNINTLATFFSGPRIREMDLAFKLWDRIIEIDPGNFDALYYSCGYRIAAQPKDQAIKYCEQLIDTDHTKGLEKIKRINALMKSGSSGLAKEKPETLVSDVFARVGAFFFDNNKFDQAIKAFEIAYSIDDTNLSVLDNIGSIYFHQIRDYGKAMGYYIKSAARIPGMVLEIAAEKGLPLNDPRIKQLRLKEEMEKTIMIAGCEYRLKNSHLARQVLRNMFMKSGETSMEKIEAAVDEMMAEIRRHDK